MTARLEDSSESAALVILYGTQRDGHATDKLDEVMTRNRTRPSTERAISIRSPSKRALPRPLKRALKSVSRIVRSAGNDFSPSRSSGLNSF